MLQNIRDKSTGWFSWIIIAAIIIVFALFGVSRYLGGGGRSDTIATVNGKAVSSSAVNALYYQLQAEARKKGFYSPTQRFATRLKKQALMSILHHETLLQDAARAGFVLSPVVVQAAIQAIPAFKVNGQFSVARYQQFIENNANAPVILNNIRNAQLLNQVSSGFMTTAFLTPAALKRLNTYISQKRDLGVFTIPLSQFSEAGNQITLAQQRAYYTKHKVQFALPAQVKLAYVELSLKSIMAGVKPSNADLQAYYQANINQYETPATWTLYQVKIPAGPSAQAKAKTLAADIAKGGKSASASIVTLNAKNIGPALQKVVDGFAAVGQVSQPVKTPQGYAVYKLLARKNASQLPFSQVQSRVETAYKQTQAQQQFNADSDQLANLTFSQPNTLLPAAKALNLKINTTGYFSKSNRQVGIEKDPNVIQTAFSSDVLTNRNNSQVINLGNSAQVVVRVQDYKPAATKSFDSVRASIKNILQIQAEIKQAKTLADKVKAKILSGKAPAAIANQYNLDYRHLGLQGRRAKKSVLAVQAGFRLSPDEKAVLLPVTGAYQVVVLNGVHNTPLKTDKKLAKLKQALVYEQGRLAYQLYQNSVIGAAKIKILHPNMQ